MELFESICSMIGFLLAAAGALIGVAFAIAALGVLAFIVQLIMHVSRQMKRVSTDVSDHLKQINDRLASHIRDSLTVIQESNKNVGSRLDSATRIVGDVKERDIEVALDEPEQSLRVGQTGKVWVRTAPRSRLADLARYAWSVLIRESSF